MRRTDLSLGRGFSMIELLIAVAVGSIALLGAFSTVYQSHHFLNQSRSSFDVESSARLIRIAMTSPSRNPPNPSICQQTLLRDSSGNPIRPAIPKSKTRIQLTRIQSFEGSVIAQVAGRAHGFGSLTSIELGPVGDDDVAARVNDGIFSSDLILKFDLGDDRTLERRIQLNFQVNKDNEIIDCLTGIYQFADTTRTSIFRGVGDCPDGMVATGFNAAGKLECRALAPRKVVQLVGCDHPNFESDPRCQKVKPTGFHGGWIMKRARSACAFSNNRNSFGPNDVGTCWAEFSCRNSSNCPTEGAAARCDWSQTMGNPVKWDYVPFDSKLPSGIGCRIVGTEPPPPMNLVWSMSSGPATAEELDRYPICPGAPIPFDVIPCPNFGDMCRMDWDGHRWPLACQYPSPY